MLTVGELPADLLARLVGRAPTFISSEATEILTKPGEDRKKVYNRFRTAAGAGYIHRRHDPNAKKTSPALFGPDDIGAAAVLFTLYDLHIDDVEIAELTRDACYAWNDSTNPRPARIPKHVPPVIAAMVGAHRGEFWGFKLDTYHCRHTNERQVFAAIFDMDAPPPNGLHFLSPSFLPRSSITVCLAPVLGPLNRMFVQERVLN